MIKWFEKYQSITNFFIITWVSVVFFLYFYHHGYFYLLTKIIWPAFLLVFVFILFFGPKTKLNAELFQRLSRRFIKKDLFEVKLKSLLFILPLFAVILANIFLFNLILGDIYYFLFDSMGSPLQPSNLLYSQSLALVYSYVSLSVIYTSVIVVFILYLFFKKSKLAQNIKFSYLALKELPHKKYFRSTIYYLFFIAAVLLLFWGATFTKLGRLVSVLTSNNILFYQINIFQKIFSVFVFYILLVLLVYSLGRKIFKIFKFSFGSKLEQFVFSVGIGFIPLMLGTFFIALLGLLYSWVIWIFVFIIFLFSWPEIKNIILELETIKIRFSTRDNISIAKLILFIFLLLALTINFIAVFKLIPTDYDSLYNYFNTVNNYVSNHGYVIHEFIPQAGMFQNFEMLSTAIVSITEFWYINHLSFLFFILSLFGIYSFSRRFYSEEISILALFLFYLPFLNLHFITTAKVEMALLFYTLLIFYVLLLLVKNNGDKIYKYSILLGIFFGVAMGIKYLIFIFLPLVLLVIFFSQLKLSHFNLKKPIFSIILFISFFSILIAPWLAKNFIYFNNPFYPYSKSASAELSSDASRVSTGFFKDRDYEQTVLQYTLIDYKESKLNYFKSLFFSFINPRKIFLYNNILPLILVILLFFPIIRTPKDGYLLYLFLLYYFIVWCFVGYFRIWYLFPILPILAILSAIFIAKVNKTIFKYIFIILLFLAAINIYESVNLTKFAVNYPVRYLIGNVKYSPYIKPLQEVSEYINDKIIPDIGDEKILFALDPRFFFVKDNYRHAIADYYLYYEQVNEEEMRRHKIRYVVYPVANNKFEERKKLYLSENEFYINLKNKSLGETIKELRNMLSNNDKLFCSSNMVYCVYRINY